MIQDLLWWVFAALGMGGAIGMISARNPVASLLFLVLSFFSLAAIYILLGAHFIGVAQVIVYAGAIMVLFMFVIMLLNLGHDYHADVRRGGWILAGFIATGLIGFGLSQVLGVDIATGDSAAPAIEASVRELGAVGAIAEPLFRQFLIPFELTSILLLVAIIGAVVLAKRRI
jgi:NADH-quinone oxidoreductase subunit J